MKRRIASLLLAITMTLAALPFASTEAEDRVLPPPGESLNTRPSWERQFQDALNNLSMGFNSTTQQYDAEVRDLIQQNSENYNFTPYVGNSFSVFAKNAPQEDGAGQSYEGMSVYEVAKTMLLDIVMTPVNEVGYIAQGAGGPLLEGNNFINDFMQATGRPSTPYNLGINEMTDFINGVYTNPYVKPLVDIGGAWAPDANKMRWWMIHGALINELGVRPSNENLANYIGKGIEDSTKRFKYLDYGGKVAEPLGYITAAMDLYNYIERASTGFSDNPFNGYPALKFALDATDTTAFIGGMTSMFYKNPWLTTGVSAYGFARDFLNAKDQTLVNTIKYSWDDLGLITEPLDNLVTAVMDYFTAEDLLRNLESLGNDIGTGSLLDFGFDQEENIEGYDHVQAMEEIWNQKLWQLIRERRLNSPEGQALEQLILERQKKWIKNDGPRAGHVDMKKPNIYLYPEAETQITVTFDRPELLTVSDPLYGDGWTVTAHPDGTLEDAGGKYGFLFYESLADPSIFRLDEGFVVKAEQREQTYRRVLEAYGFNEQEILDFIEYWTDYLEPGVDYVMYPLLTEGVDAEMPVRFSVQPDNIFRLWFGFVRYEGGAVPEPEIVPMDRSGFEAVEWGGAVLN